jgi:polysaccharide pyruvyl transferase WcaK-like protein
MTNVTIGLLWHSANSDNLGVGALTASNIAIIDSLSEILGLSTRFLILGWKDPGPVYITNNNVEVVALRTRDLIRPSKLHSALKRCDFVIDISAGDSFADIYGSKRIGKNFLGKLAVLLARKPLVFGPQTIGPFKASWARQVSDSFMKKAELVTTRDRLSSEYVSRLDLGDKAIEATDVAMRLPYDPDKYPRGEKVRVGLNVSGLLFNGGYTGKNMFDLRADYPTVVRRIIRTLQDQETAPEIHLIGHVNSDLMPIEDDYGVCQVLSREFPGTVLAPRFEGPSDAKSYIASTDFFAGARMHACIAAFSSGVPVVPMAYSRKFEGLFGTLGYHRTTDCRVEAEDEIVGAVVGGFLQRNVLKAEVDTAFETADSKLAQYESRISGLLRQVQNGVKG